MTARLIDTGPICYLDNQGRLVWRPCRTWADLWPDDTTRMCIITEVDDMNTSIETAAAQIRDALEATHGYQVHIIEHWPVGTGSSTRREYYAEQYRNPAGRIAWKPMLLDDLTALLGDTLHTTTPTGPVVNGTWPMAGPSPTNGAPL